MDAAARDDASPKGRFRKPRSSQKPQHAPLLQSPEVQRPAPAVLTDGRPADEQLEALELDTLSFRTLDSRRLRHAPAWYHSVEKFWSRNVHLLVPHVDCRDHLANERTFLAYLRTSLALSMIGVVIAQLYRLQHSPDAGTHFGYHALSDPLSVTFQGAAITVVLLACIRYFRQQAAMERGKVHAGGFDIYTVMALSFLLLLALFTLHIATDVWDEAGRNDRPAPSGS